MYIWARRGLKSLSVDHPDHQFRVQDTKNHRIYFVTAMSDEDYVRQRIDEGIDELARGNVEEWNVENMLGEFNEGHARHQS